MTTTPCPAPSELARRDPAELTTSELVIASRFSSDDADDADRATRARRLARVYLELRRRRVRAQRHGTV